MKASAREEDGVIGYQARTLAPAMTQPIAVAALPSMMILPAVLFMRSRRNGSVLVRFFPAHSKPPWIASQLIATAFSFDLNWRTTALWISSMSMSRSQAATPT